MADFKMTYSWKKNPINSPTPTKLKKTTELLKDGQGWQSPADVFWQLGSHKEHSGPVRYMGQIDRTTAVRAGTDPLTGNATVSFWPVGSSRPKLTGVPAGMMRPVSQRPPGQSVGSRHLLNDRSRSLARQ